ncbi:MAG: family 16 glycosylhydrolase [Calditrichaeota bacterium]|nr:family 16 glycosylhydrolase [Calditrichota bacterium]
MKKTLLLILLSLSFVLPAEAKSLKGAELRTLQSYTYGRFEVRYRAVQASGALASFFTFHDNISSTKDWNEIDIEIMGRYTDEVQLNTITAGQTSHVYPQWVSFNPAADFHTYAFEWTPNAVAWFIDGKEVVRQTGEHIATLNKPQKIMMNIWPPAYSNWAGKWNPAVLPLFAYYDWVSYASYTPGRGNTGTDHNFTLQWKDDFDRFDASRWAKATHTFSGNNCDFTPENAVFKDGFLILCLTDAEHTGFVDRNPPTVLWARAAPGQVTVRFSEAVEQASAEKRSHYSIPGATIQSATLQKDAHTVVLEVPDLDLGQSYNLVVLGIRDRAPQPNLLTGKLVPIIMPQPLTFPVKINVGGPSVLGFLPDQEWGPDVEYGFEDGQTATISPGIDIKNTSLDAIYRSERYGLVAYRVRVPNGLYKVTLLMAENSFQSTGARVFDVAIEGKKVVSNLDLFETVGEHVAYPKVIRGISVTDGVLDVYFGASVNHALLNGLVVEPEEEGVLSPPTEKPESFHLFHNYPNPFSRATSIRFRISEAGHVRVEIYNILGQEVAVLLNQVKPAGEYRVEWQPRLKSGLFFCRVDWDSRGKRFSKTRKLLLLR